MNWQRASVCVDFNSPHAWLAMGPTRALEQKLGAVFDWRPRSIQPLPSPRPLGPHATRGERHRSVRAAYVERDLALVTVTVPTEKRGEIVELVNLFRGKVIDVSKDSVMIEISGTESKLESLIDLLRPYGIKELARTGVIAMARGQQPAKDDDAGKNSGGKRVRSITAASTQALPPS
jgi:hypothetical protein